MEISKPASASSAVLLASAKALTARFQVGQVLQALVVTAPRGGRVVLELAGQQLAAATSLQLRQGQAIQVQVERGRDPVVLRVLPEPRGSAEVQRSALRSALPRQTSLAPLLANLQAVAPPAGAVGTRPAAPPAVAEAAGRLLQSLPGAREVTTPQGLREAARHSGTFFEAALARAAAAGTGTPAQDLKAQLLRLLGLVTRPAGAARTGAGRAAEGGARPTPGSPPATAAGPPAAGRGAPSSQDRPATPAPGDRPATSSTHERPAGPSPRADATPPPQRGRPPVPQPAVQPSLPAGAAAEQVAAEIRHQTEGALNRLLVHQLNSLPAEDGGRLQWSLEIPFRSGEGIDILALRIGRDGGGQGRDGDGDGDGDGARAWTVELGLDLAGLGPLTTRLTLRAGRLAAVLWAENPATVATVQPHLAELREALEAAGLEVTRLGIYAGRPPADPAGDPGPSGLLSVTA